MQGLRPGTRGVTWAQMNPAVTLEIPVYAEDWSDRKLAARHPAL